MLESFWVFVFGALNNFFQYGTIFGPRLCNQNYKDHWSWLEEKKQSNLYCGYQWNIIFLGDKVSDTEGGVSKQVFLVLLIFVVNPVLTPVPT